MTISDPTHRPPADVFKPTGGYVMDNHHRASPAHHEALAALLDGHTRSRITQLVSLSGAHCLEVGAGGGSIATWLARQVGERGRVVATDVKPDRIHPDARMQILAHDLAAPARWPPELAGPFDLIVARMVLAHLPARRRILQQLTDRLAQGGVLLVEDWLPCRDDPVITAPTRAASDLYRAYQQAIATVLAEAGGDPGWARTVHTAMRQESLTRVETVITGGYWYGGSAGCRLLAAVAAQLRPRLLAAGMTAIQHDMLLALFDDEQLVLHGHPLYSTSGYASPPRR